MKDIKLLVKHSTFKCVTFPQSVRDKAQKQIIFSPTHPRYNQKDIFSVQMMLIYFRTTEVMFTNSHCAKTHHSTKTHHILLKPHPAQTTIVNLEEY